METHPIQQADHLTTREVSTESPEYADALHLLLGVSERRLPDRNHPTVREFLDDAQCRSLRIEPVVATFSGKQMVAAAAGVESPGSAALVLAPVESACPTTIMDYVPSVRSVCRGLRSRCVLLTEFLVPSGDSPWSTVAQGAGLDYLTDLVYLVRRAGYHSGPGQIRRDLRWIPFTHDSRSVFEQTIVATYAGSADCPELCGVRPARDVLAGHRAAGDFDGALWSVAMHNGTPVGIVLLARLSHHNALELVYMGVIQNARGQGVGDALLRRAVDTLELEGATTLALAVDERNAQARRVYKRWGFTERARRSVWIATP